jgi:glycosyltransferase involved in cell wall biosynthesis
LKNPKISVVIPTKNRAKDLLTMLTSLTKQTYKNFEVVIVDGGSTDNTSEIVESFRDKLDIKFAIQEGGLLKQENKAIELISGDVYLRTDDDAEYPPQVLKELAKTFELGDYVGGATGPTITPNKKSRDLFAYQNKLKKGPLWWKLAGKLYYDYILEGKATEVGKFFKSGAVSLGANLPHALSLAKPQEVDMFECITMGIRADLLKKIGGFDMIYDGVAEYNEVDIAFKIKKLGYKIILNPKAAAYHHTSRTGAFSARANSYSRNMNFINFQFRHLKPKTLDDWGRFLAYLMFQNMYYTYIFFHSPRVGLLGCWPASIIGIAKNIIDPLKNE